VTSDIGDVYADERHFLEWLEMECHVQDAFLSREELIESFVDAGQDSAEVKGDACQRTHSATKA
jgi:hypothetical protein